MTSQTSSTIKKIFLPDTDNARQALLTTTAIPGVFIVLCVIKATHQMKVALPVPFLLLNGAGTRAAGIAGLTTALATSTLIALFVIYSTYRGFGPSSLTGGLAGRRLTG